MREGGLRVKGGAEAEGEAQGWALDQASLRGVAAKHSRGPVRLPLYNLVIATQTCQSRLNDY